MRKRLYNVIIALFICACMLPSAGMLIFGPSQPGANEILAGPPALTGPDGSFNRNVLSDTEKYFADRFAFRQEFITAWSRLNASLLRSSVEEDVVLGSDGWLYYGQTLDDYTGRTVMDERQIFCAAYNLKLMQDCALSRGADFVFTVAPNKNSVYPEHMPDYKKISGPRNIELLRAALAAQGVNYVELFDLFEDSGEVLYYRMDSHWNSKGAALAADRINSALSRPSDFAEGPFTPRESHLGDLYKMLYPAGRELETDPEYDGGLSFSYNVPIRSAEDISIFTSSAGKSGSLLMFRDSFGNTLYPYMAQSFGSACFSRATPSRLTMAADRAADTVVIELVERNLANLAKGVPVMPAPQREVTAQRSSEMTARITERTPGDIEGYVLLKGQLVGADMDADSPVYVCADGQCFAAFLTASEAGERGFGLYVPDTSESDIDVIYYNDYVPYRAGYIEYSE
ncbi:MAG: hypothetical protein IJG63_03540 [Oscillospiraceae bacterium]|nr:hypothetical protein [Oscillospiraceae bacterium]